MTLFFDDIEIPVSPPTEEDFLTQLMDTSIKQKQKQSIIAGLTRGELTKIFKEIRTDPNMTENTMTYTGLSIKEILRLHEIRSYERSLERNKKKPKDAFKK
jgi:hypothetical protein